MGLQWIARAWDLIAVPVNFKTPSHPEAMERLAEWKDYGLRAGTDGQSGEGQRYATLEGDSQGGYPHVRVSGASHNDTFEVSSQDGTLLTMPRGD